MYCTTKCNHCYILSIQALVPVVSEQKTFSCYSFYKPIADYNAPGRDLFWTPGAWLAGFIKRITKHCYTQNIEAPGLMVSEKKILLFSYCKSMLANDPRDVANLYHRGKTGRIYVGLH